MKINVIVSLIIGYLITFHPIFTEPFTVTERFTTVIGMGVTAFFGLLKLEDILEKK